MNGHQIIKKIIKYLVANFLIYGHQIINWADTLHA